MGTGRARRQVRPRRTFRSLLLLAACGLTLFGAAAKSAAGPPINCDTVGNTTPPNITGNNSVGSTLNTTNGKWTSCDGTKVIGYNYAWYSDGIQVGSDTSSTYTVTEDDIGASIHVVVTAFTTYNSGSADSNTVTIPGAGPADADQTAETGDESTASPASPQPMTPAGPAAGGSYSTELWPSGATETTDGLQVVSSTATGTTASTGVVVDDVTEAPIAGATVTMSCSASCGTAPTTSTTDAQGAFAFTSMPATTYDVTINKTGYGTYKILNEAYDSDATYFRTAFMTTAPYTSDMAGTAAAANPTTAEVTDLPGTAFSQRRVPPSIRVAMADVYPRNSSGPFCTLRSGSANTAPVRTFSWNFYISHVVAPELGPSLLKKYADPTLAGVPLKAFTSIVQNFAWFHETKPGSYDVTDIGGGYAGQCFRLDERVTVGQWTAWFDDIKDERIANSDRQLMLTQYQSGTSPGYCADPDSTFAVRNGVYATQYGILAHALPHQPAAPTNVSCQITDWRALASLYYPSTWLVRPGWRPPTATGSFTTGGGSITLNFHSRVYGLNVAWKFYLQKLTSTGWHTFKITGWSPTAHNVIQTYTFTPPTTACTRYRVKAVNPYNDPVVHGSIALANTPAGSFTPAGYGIRPSGQCAL